MRKERKEGEKEKRMEGKIVSVGRKNCVRKKNKKAETRQDTEGSNGGRTVKNIKERTTETKKRGNKKKLKKEKS